MLCLGLGLPWISFALAGSVCMISLDHSSLFYTVINLIFVFSLLNWAIIEPLCEANIFLNAFLY